MIITVTMNASVDKRYHVERLVPGSVMRVASCRSTAGGKGLNVARALRRLGAEVTATGIAGGRNGEFILRELEALGIGRDFAPCTGESRCCVNVVEAGTGRQTEFLEPGPTVGRDVLKDFLSRLGRLAERAEAVVVSGSLPSGVPQVFYAHVISLAKASGARVILDVSGPALPAALPAGPDLVKPNLEEAGELLGRRLAAEDDAACAAERLVASGAASAAVSMGPRGVVYASPEGMFLARPPRIVARNAVGCGDCLAAGFAQGIIAGWGAERGLRFAVALSAASAMCEETGGFEEADLEDVLPRVEVSRLA
jgi:tagatose 6-phosphate kinase